MEKHTEHPSILHSKGVELALPRKASGSQEAHRESGCRVDSAGSAKNTEAYIAIVRMRLRHQCK